MIFHNKPTLGHEEIKAVKDVIKSGWLVQGKKTEEFENELCRYIGLQEGDGVALSSGAAALYVALKVLGVKRNDEVIVPTYVCTSLLNAVYLAQAKPVVVDVNENDFNISLPKIKEKINKKTKAIIAPHMFGVPADIISMKKELDVPIIEDCATAIGSKIGEKYAGIFADISIFSFYASKMIATGQGGMFVSKNQDYIRKARDFIDFDLGKGKERGKRTFYPRFNFEITDIQSALGIVQFKKIGKFLRKRSQIAKDYEEICKIKGWDFQKPSKDNFYPNNYRFVIKSDEKTVGNLHRYLKARGIETIIPIENWELLHRFLGQNPQDFPVSEKITKTTLSLPIYPSLSDKEIRKIKSALMAY